MNADGFVTVTKQQQPGSVVLVGGGGHAAVVAEAADLSGWRLGGYLDDRDQNGQDGINYLGPFQDCLVSDWSHAIILAVGCINTRQRLIERYTGELATIAHPSAIVSSRACLGSGTFLGAAAIVHPVCEIDQHVIVNSRALVEHHCRIGCNSHIGPGVVLGGNVHVGANTLIGLSAVVKPNVRIGRDCIVGAGAVVTRDVADGSTVAGIPARPLRSRPTSQPTRLPSLRRSA